MIATREAELIRLVRALVDASTDYALLVDTDSHASVTQANLEAATRVLKELLGRDPSWQEILAATGIPEAETEQ